MNSDFDVYTGIYKNSNGGTETMYRRIQSLFPLEFEKYQIIISRITGHFHDKPKIFWTQEDADEPSQKILEKAEVLDKFSGFVFVTYAQFYKFCIRYPELMNRKCVVIQNAIDPIILDKPKSKELKFIYHSAPHRGLNDLYLIFKEILKDYPNATLDVFSSFNVYGWSDRDQQFSTLFNELILHPNIFYHGYQPNYIIKNKLKDTTIFLYPTLYPETSCIAAIEAQSAKNLVLIPKITESYFYRRPLEETLGQKFKTFSTFDHIIEHIEFFQNGEYDFDLTNEKLRVDNENNFDIVSYKWNALFRELEK